MTPMTLRANRERKLIKFDDNNFYSTDLNQKYELDNHEEEFNELTKIFFD